MRQNLIDSPLANRLDIFVISKIGLWTVECFMLVNKIINHTPDPHKTNKNASIIHCVWGDSVLIRWKHDDDDDKTFESDGNPVYNRRPELTHIECTRSKNISATCHSQQVRSHPCKIICCNIH